MEEFSRRAVSRAFFNRPPVEVARALLSTVVVHRLNGVTLAGRIVETEAYLAYDDPAAHSYRGLTNRTRVIFGPPGRAYIYFIYGMHHCLNLVAEPQGVPGCVLIRALEPVAGFDEMRRRRPKAKSLRDLASGPGKLTQAMGVTAEHYGADVTRGALTVRPLRRPGEFTIVAAPRVGVTSAKELPLRFYIQDNECVSVR